MTAFWCELPRDAVRVAGADALTYLQSQVSQDLRQLGDGQSTYSFLLQPAGKIDSLIRISRRGPESFVIDTDPGFGEAVVARLNRFKIRVAVELALEPWQCIAVRGVEAGHPAWLNECPAAWGLSDAFDIVAPRPEPPTGIAHGSQAQLEQARVAAGWPSMGAEITDATIPAEVGHVVALAVSFTKGCYPGQELVERMDSRGSSAPRSVRRLQGTGEAEVGDEVVVTDGGSEKVVGRLTTVVADPSGAGWSALGVVARSVAAGATVNVRGSAADVYEADPNSV